MKIPNVIFIQCDSMDGRTMGYRAHTALKRAILNPDRLASVSTLFGNTIPTIPYCALYEQVCGMVFRLSTVRAGITIKG